jgi:cytoskeleton protein RodZ
MDVGLELRQARERRGITLQQISNTTKISLRVLQAIEAADELRLPAKVFTRSFVKTYAAQVGLDPADTTRRYLEQLEPPPAPSQTPAATGESIPDTPMQQETPDRRVARVLQGRFGTASVLLLTALTAVALVTKNYRQAPRDEAPHAAPIVSAASPIPAAAPKQPTPVGTSGASQGADALHLVIAPTGPCWVRATVDGQPVLAKLLAAGDRRQVDTSSDVTLRVGDPAVFAFSINGAPARIPGAPGEAVTVRITKENYSRFLTR